jgi:hypothetical protein
MADTRPLLPALVFGGLIALGLASAGLLVGNGLENARTGDRAVTVRGLAEREVKADLAVLPLRFTASGDALEAAQAQVDAQTGAVRAFLAAQGFPAAAVDLGAFDVTDHQSQEYQQQNYAARFIVSQTVVVRSNDVDRVQATVRRLNELVRQGVVLEEYSPTYLFTRLNAVRPAMIGEATAAARTGAAQFAEDSGSDLGGIRSATQGSFEILGRDEVGEETSQVFKRIRVVTTVSYGLR